MALKPNKTISSPLVSALNNIVSINRSGSTIKSTQQSYQGFLKFMDVEIQNIEGIKLPKKKDIKKISNLNIASTFGSAGSLLSSLANGALDAAGFIGDFFSGKKRQGAKPNPKAGGAIPKGKGIRLGGLRALGIVNAAFAGLDFATGLAEGESAGKAAAGAGGALAGSLIGGAIGQTLIPIPGLGFVVGSIAGNFAGGFLGDRAHEVVTGTGEQDFKSKQKEKLKAQEVKQKAAAMSSGLTISSVLDKFDSVVTKFERASPGASSDTSGATNASDTSEQSGIHEEIKPRTDGGPPTTDIDNSDYTATGGSLPSKNDPGGKDYNQFRQYYNGGKGGRHQGEDLGVAQGTAVSIVVPGKVAAAGFDGGSAGGNILITHVDGKQTRYLHMSEINVSAGQEVKSGQVIGKTGGTPGTKGAGRSTGAHLHFEYYGSTGGGPMDPWPHMDKYFRFGGNVSVKKKDGAPPGGTSGGGTKPTVVLAAGTNDYGDPEKVKSNVEKSIKDLQSKGYNVVVVPPNEKGKFAGVHKAVLEASASSGATVEKGKYDTNDPLHLQMSEASRIKQKFAGAEILGDSNAARIAGGSMSNVAGKRVVGAGTGDILKFAQGMGRVVPVATSQVAPTQTQAPIQQLQQYPTYNQQQSSTTIVPILMSAGGGGQQKPQVISVSGGGGGGQTIMLPGPSGGQVLNSLLKTMLLTNLSGT
jgi:murein DD-endopeptidase MepM/ murein hydrolase activator NlpD